MSKVPYRVAIVDLDDTLLGKDKNISAANVQALKRLREAGMEVVVASGRHHLSIVTFEEKIGNQGWIISAGGAMVKHAATGEVLYEFTVPMELALEIYRRNRESGDSLITYHRTGVYVEEMTDLTRLDAKRSMQLPQKGDLPALARDGLQKLMWSAWPEQIAALFPMMEREYSGRLYVVHTEPELIEFLSP